jgi:hypothetical protein
VHRICDDRQSKNWKASCYSFSDLNNESAAEDVLLTSPRERRARSLETGWAGRLMIGLLGQHAAAIAQESWVHCGGRSYTSLRYWCEYGNLQHRGRRGTRAAALFPAGSSRSCTAHRISVVCVQTTSRRALIHAIGSNATPSVQDRKINYIAIIGDKKLGDEFGLATMPMTILIDRNGNIASDRETCEKQIRTLLAEKTNQSPVIRELGA